MAATSSSFSKVSLKLLIDKKSQKVLFAEAGKDFIDFLFTLLTLPIGTVIRLLNTKDMVGCLGKLYQSVSDLNDDYMQPHQQKDVVLKPKVGPSFACPLIPLVPQSSTTVETKFYKCGRCSSSLLSPNSRTSCSNCGRTMTTVVTYHVPKTSAVPVPAVVEEGGGYVKGIVTYMVMDDLVVAPMSTISSINLLNKFNIKDLSALQEKVVQIGMDEGLELLKHALGSKTVLTNVFLTRMRKSARGRSEVV
ncbi:tyramine N-feruloyltransferase 4/11-like protein [Tanacetum coccineum]